jgi:hypothetical protein
MRSALFLGLLTVVAGAATTFPYENEAYVPPELAAATPSGSYDDQDPGGYHYQYIWYLDLNTVDMPWCAMISNSNQYTLVVTFSASPVLPITVWNCTAKDQFFTDSDFTGMANNAKVCDVGSCCSDMIGEAKFSEDQMEWHTWLDNLASAGVCNDAISEGLYCVSVNGHYHGNCHTRVLSGTTRTVTMACGDNAIVYWMSCSVYKNAPIDYGWVQEPPMYTDGNSLEMTMLLSTSTEESDHICHPYSYYYPGSNGGSSTAGDDDDDDDDDSSPAAALFATLFMLFA